MRFILHEPYRTTFRDLWVGGVLVKHVLFRFVDLLFERKTNPSRYQIQFGTDSYSHLNNISTNITQIE